MDMFPWTDAVEVVVALDRGHVALSGESKKSMNESIV